MQHLKKSLLALSTVALLLNGCQQQSSEQQAEAQPKQQMEGHWPNAVTYEIFIQSFHDSDGDGIGDIKGMTSKLDYLDELGVEAVWLMPIGPSPSYHKYDVTDYRDIHPDYGTLEDFKEFVREAHKRDIRVVMDLVVNHTARAHPWFQEAVKDKNSPYRDYYVWAELDSIKDQLKKKQTHHDSDNITQWHEAEGNKERYYGYFWGGMPDLNFDNPEVKKEVFDIGRFWLTDVGVDGFRLDAARHIFPDERAEDNHNFWVEFRAEMQKANPDVYLVGEVWSDSKTVAPYLKGLPALFNFDLGYAITDAVNNEDARDLIEKHKEIRTFYKSVNPNYIDATFITNHDQNRIMSAVNGDENKAKMASALLFTLPGSPYIYYGEEIGMEGMKPDEHIREPFLWKNELQAAGQAQWVEPKYSTLEKVDPLEAQMNDSASLYNHYKELIHTRKENPALTFGKIEYSDMEEHGVVSFYRVHEQDSVLVLHNLSGERKELDGTAFNKVLFNNAQQSKATKGLVQLAPYSTLIMSK